MPSLLKIGLALALATALTACKGPAEKETLISPLETVTVETGGGPVVFRVEIADDDKERADGLMFRKSLAPDRGMLFDFDEAEPRGFWMKNTLIPLDIIYIGPDGSIVSIAEMTTPMSEEAIPSRGSASAVLEIPGGRAGATGIKPGDRVRHRIFPQ